MAAHFVDADTARARVRDAAARAGVPEVEVALAVLREGQLP